MKEKIKVHKDEFENILSGADMQKVLDKIKTEKNLFLRS